ncbi:hypothetical protein ADL01_28675 [Streptomyces sp. NRRL WC-3618]|nr:hypothetical protein ADL01_28675 [Streptomyces sp. NRRL WC-3618]
MISRTYRLVMGGVLLFGGGHPKPEITGRVKGSREKDGRRFADGDPNSALRRPVAPYGGTSLVRWG